MSISILLLMLFVHTPVHQLLKLSSLVEHYWEHKSKNNKISIAEFLTIHYTKGDVKDEDTDKDMQLPFKQCSPSLIFTYFEHPFEAYKEKVHFLSELNQLSLYRSPYHSLESTSNIWHPPKG